MEITVEQTKKVLFVKESTAVCHLTKSPYHVSTPCLSLSFARYLFFFFFFFLRTLFI